jgi:SWI/SNF-related matrix-associated actin-dependent regulator 1 of chromatin subfamily A
MSIAKKIPHVIALSGTPAINRPAELFNSIRLIEPKLFANFYEFGMKYCGATHNGYGWNFNGASNLSELMKF